MSLPFVLDYLMLKTAEEPPKREPTLLTRSSLKTGLQGAAAIALGTGAGYGAGKLLGYGADALSKKFTGQPLPTKYFPPAVAGLGLLGSLALVNQRKRYEELLRNANKDSADRTARGAASK